MHAEFIGQKFTVTMEKKEKSHPLSLVTTSFRLALNLYHVPLIRTKPVSVLDVHCPNAIMLGKSKWFVLDSNDINRSTYGDLCSSVYVRVFLLRNSP